ncbi:MAG: hypothetical protein GY736_05065 [Sphingomonas sp.]|uniref:hypothetical protein n=1 Tax=Sphingomonas sp. TaxID=28214 RepID=UPI00258A4266|nr:hypothetical protein [Sphingomonas sp.]MCP4025669.1 hypothetical protein [Sphingomonas sp.]
MSPFFGRVDLRAFRRDPLQIVLHVVGVDLTGVPVRYAAGFYPDIDPAFRSLTLGPTDTPGDDGARLVEVVRIRGLPVSVVEIIASKALMATLPAAGEIGADLPLAHELAIDRLPINDGLTPVETTLFTGTLTIKGSLND